MTSNLGSSTASQPSFSYEEMRSSLPTVKQIKREPMLVYSGKCGDCDLLPSIVAAVFCSLYGIVTCCKCCSGDCVDIYTYQKLPICQEPLEPNKGMDILPESSSEEAQQKLVAAREQLGQLDQTLNTRRKVHRCASTLLCPVVFLPRSIDCVLCTIADCEEEYDDGVDRSQSRRPPPETQLDLMYQFTLPCLKQDEERGRLGLRQFLSPPEVQRMIELETTIIPGLEQKAEVRIH